MASIKNLNVGDTFCDKTIQSIEIKDNVYTFTLDGSIKELKPEYFNDYTEITTIKFNNTISSIDDNVFNNCNKLTDIDLSELKSIPVSKAYANKNLIINNNISVKDLDKSLENINDDNKPIINISPSNTNTNTNNECPYIECDWDENNNIIFGTDINDNPVIIMTYEDLGSPNLDTSVKPKVKFGVNTNNQCLALDVEFTCYQPIINTLPNTYLTLDSAISIKNSSLLKKLVTEEDIDNVTNKGIQILGSKIGVAWKIAKWITKKVVNKDLPDFFLDKLEDLLADTIINAICSYYNLSSSTNDLLHDAWDVASIFLIPPSNTMDKENIFVDTDTLIKITNDKVVNQYTPTGYLVYTQDNNEITLYLSQDENYNLVYKDIILLNYDKVPAYTAQWYWKSSDGINGKIYGVTAIPNGESEICTTVYIADYEFNENVSNAETKELSNIILNTDNIKKSYYKNENIDITGLTIIAIYTDNSTSLIDIDNVNYILSVNNENDNIVTVNIIYGNCIASYNINLIIDTNSEDNNEDNSDGINI